MSRYIYRSFVVCCFLSLTVMIHAASEAEYGKISKSWTLHADGSQEYRRSMELTLFTHTAMNNTYGESFIVYNPAYQEVRIHTSYTKQKDGTIIETPENAFVEVLPGYATKAAAYNKLTELVVVHTGLELGATIYLDYSVLTKPGYYPALDVDEFIQETSPVKEYRIALSVPENMPLHKQLYGINAKAVETIQNGNRLVSWTVKNIAASSREPFRAENKNDAPRLTATSYPSLNNALGLLKKQFDAAKSMEPETFALFLTEEMKAKDEKVAAIHKYVLDKVATSRIPLHDNGYRIRNGEDVIRSSYGTLAEKTQLLYSMLNAAGIQADIVAVYPGNPEANACGLKAVKDLLVRISIEGKEQFLSAVNPHAESVYYRAGLDRLFTLQGQELQIEQQPLVVDEAKELQVKQGQVKDGYVVCSLPAISKGVDGWRMQSLNSQRNTLFEIPAKLQQTVTYTITPEEGLQLHTPQKTVVVENPLGVYRQTITDKSGKIEVVRTLEINKVQFTPKEYTQVRALINEWMNPAKRILLFKKQ